MTFVWKITSSMYCPAHKNKPSFQPKGDTLTLFTAVFWNRGRGAPDITGHALAPSLLLAEHTAPLPRTAHGTGEQTQQCGQEGGLSAESTTLSWDPSWNAVLSGHTYRRTQVCYVRLPLRPWIQTQPCPFISTQETRLPCSLPPYCREFLSSASLKAGAHPHPHAAPHKTLLIRFILQDYRITRSTVCTEVS